MIPRILSIVAPLVAYATLLLVVRGVYRERSKLDRWTLLIAGTALAASLALRPFEHLLFFDEDIYTNIASNLAHAPVSQLTIYGTAGDPRISTYYKEPSGYPILLSLVFCITGTSETAAFILARILFALSTAAVFQLARALPVGAVYDRAQSNTFQIACGHRPRIQANEVTRVQAITAAALFAATPAVFAYSASAGTDLAATLFSTLGIWGIVAGNGFLAAAGLAYAAQVRMEFIVLIPILFAVRSISMRWKVLAAALAAVQVFHISWVLRIAPQLAKVERVTAAFSTHYVLPNLLANARYLLNPLIFPALVPVFAGITVFSRQMPHRLLLLSWIAIPSAVYLFFYAGSFDLNPRYCISIAAPLMILASSLTPRKLLLSLLWLSLVVVWLRPFTLPDYVQMLASDHRTATTFGKTLDRNTLVLTTEPEEFMNAGKFAMNAIYASEQPVKFREAAKGFKRVVYYAGIRTDADGTPEQAADRWVKSNFQLHLIDSRIINGLRIAYYDLLI